MDPFAGRLQYRKIGLSNALTGPHRAGADFAYAGPHPVTDLFSNVPTMPALSTGRHAMVTLRVRAESQVASWTALIHQSCRAASPVSPGLCADRFPGTASKRANPRRAQDARSIGVSYTPSSSHQDRPSQRHRLEQRVADVPAALLPNHPSLPPFRSDLTVIRKPAPDGRTGAAMVPPAG